MPVERVCGNCAHCVEICCDYGVCEEDLKGNFRLLVRPLKVADWIADNLVDMQETECSRFESVYGEEE